MLSTEPPCSPIVLFCFVRVVFTFLDLFMCLSILSACMYVHLVCAGRGQKKAVSPLEWSSGMVRSHAYGCWKSNPGPLQEQQVLVTVKPSLFF